ncbi:class D beta-lactamase [Thiocapsa marina]|uniref:Beta-lactamase n=1 Tax=Thiocapsa marina 5811 TaxID=768671 RepID=F9U9Q4_9GAMM|nr:class D beta-lactamase [Thiocapsa marina]EGV18852.1 Beta-lactamase [Thiocapsa marina 5811]
MPFLLVLIVALFAAAPGYAEDADLAALFAVDDVEGTLVIADLDGDSVYVHNVTRAAQRFPAASTFKILNTLVALEEGVVAGPDALIPWDGRVHDMSDWNRDHTLATAFATSCVWCYQTLAREIGAERYRSHLERAGYGELAEPFDPVAFWLDGTLTISALEQVEFLRRVILRTLPYRDSSYAGLRRVMLAETTEQHRLFAKTGWATRATPQIGWYVGYVETPEATWIFALNMDTRSAEDLPLRLQLVRAGLQAKGIIDPPEAVPRSNRVDESDALE